MTEKFDKQLAEGTAEQAIKERALATFDTRASFSTFYRFIIIETIFDPSIVDDKKIAYWEHELGVTNIKFASVLPRNSIIALPVLEGVATATTKPMFLFPFLPPQISLPCNPGEHVWVYFENKTIKKSDLGFWMWRIVGPGFVEDVNHTHLPRMLDPGFHPGTKDLYEGNVQPTYEFRPGQVEITDGERSSVYETSTIAGEDEQAYEKLMTDSDAGRIRHYEAIPRYKKRPEDTVFEGTNNALIVMGRHRRGPVADYDDDELRGKVPKIPEGDIIDDGAAQIDFVVGRGQTPKTLGTVVENSIGKNELGKSSNELAESEGDLDFKNDRTRAIIFQKSRVDVDFGLDGFNGKFSIEDSESGDGAAVIKTDKIRLIARSDIQLIVTGNERDENGNMKSLEDTSKFATLIITAKGDIILQPSDAGFFKIGGPDANKALVCTDDATPVSQAGGEVTAGPLTTTMGGQFAGTKIPTQGSYAKKILVT
jgi:hypothetical protein